MKRNRGLSALLPFFGATLLALGSIGCPGETTTDAGMTDPDPPPTCDLSPCKRNIDCAAGAICEKDTGAGVDDWGCCLKILCTADADCDDSEVCDQRRGLCVPEDLCDPGNPAAKCQAGEFCIYQAGLPQCVAESALPQPDDCTITPDPIFITAGQDISLDAVGSLSSGALVPNAVFTFTVAGGDVGTIDAGTNVLSAACTEATPCTGEIQAAAGGATCTTPVTVYPTVAEGFRAVVFDTQSGAPVAGAPVALQIDGEADLVTVMTDDSGAATFTAAQVTGTVLAASTFPANHQWQTVLAPAGTDIAFWTISVPDDTKSAGMKGTFNFDDVSTQGDIKLGLSGMSIRSSLVDTDFSLLLGEIADYEIELEGVTNGPENVPLPTGLVIELGTTQIKPDFVAQGDPGKRILWALGGKVRLAEIGPIISSVTASEEVNFGSILNAVLPFFAKFDHAVVTGLDIQPQDKPVPPMEDAPIPYEAWNFDELTGANAVRLNTLLSQSTTYGVPSLPCANGAFSDGNCTDNKFASGAILLSGVIVPGQGIVPLGLTAGLDDPDDQDSNDQVDGLLDYSTDNAPDKGDAIVDYAPPHDGLEGNPYITIAVALDIAALADGGGLSISTIVDVSDAFGSGQNNFTQDFVQQQGGTFNQGAQTLAFNPVGDADFYRVNLNDGLAEWNIYFKDAPSAAIDLNALRGTVATGRTDAADVQAFALGNGFLSGAAQPDFDDLVSFNGTNLDESFVFYMGGWASTACEAASDDVPEPFCEEVP